MQDRAKRTYKLWISDPNHPSLKYGRVHPAEQVYSVRIGLHWRALAIVEQEAVVWFWIGLHSDYDKILDSI